MTINTTIMTDNLHEIEDIVKLAKELHTGISVAVAHEYCNADASAPTADETAKIAKKLIEMKEKGLSPCEFNQLFQSHGKRKELEVQTLGSNQRRSKGKLGSTLLCSLMNTQPAFLFLKPTSKPQSLDLTGKKHRTARNAFSTVM